MNKTQIEWVLNQDGTQGYTCSSKTGCDNHKNGLCKGGGFPCYAYGLANGRCKQRYLSNINIAPPNVKYRGSGDGFSAADIIPDVITLLEAKVEAYNDPFYPRFWPGRLEQIRKRKKPTGIFLDDMSDWMGDCWPKKWTEAELQVMRDCPQHRFYTLTKQPQNLVKFPPFPDNCWLGVTATNRRMFVEALIVLKDIRAMVRYISIEPCLERIGSDKGWIFEGAENQRLDDGFMMKLSGINWVIIGAQTKPYKPPKLEWVQEIALACTKAHIPLFIKDNLRPLLPNRMPFWCPVTWTELDKGVPIRMTENRLRQEMPK